MEWFQLLYSTVCIHYVYIKNILVDPFAVTSRLEERALLSVVITISRPHWLCVRHVLDPSLIETIIFIYTILMILQKQEVYGFTKKHKETQTETTGKPVDNLKTK